MILPPEVSALPHMSLLRTAVRDRQIHEIAYQRIDGTPTERRIRPLHLEYWGRVWTCSAWCELRNGFRVFRVDLIRQAGVVGNFEDESGKTLKDMLDARACHDDDRP